jgi:hypothetical protein
MSWSPTRGDRVAPQDVHHDGMRKDPQLRDVVESDGGIVSGAFTELDHLGNLRSRHRRLGGRSNAGVPNAHSRTCRRLSVVHDRIRLRQHQIAAIARNIVTIDARHKQRAGTTEGGETVGGSSVSRELSPGRGRSEMISDGCPDANCEVGVKCVGENLLCRGVQKFENAQNVPSPGFAAGPAPCGRSRPGGMRYH